MGGAGLARPPASHPQHAGGAAGLGKFGGLVFWWLLVPSPIEHPCGWDGGWWGVGLGRGGGGVGAAPHGAGRRGILGWPTAGPPPGAAGEGGSRRRFARTAPRAHLGFSSRRRWRRGGRGPARRAGGDAAPGAGASCRAKGARRTGTAPAPRRGVAPRTESRTMARKGWAPAAGRGGGPARPAAAPPASRAARGGWWGARRGPPGQCPRRLGWLLSPGAG